MTFPIEWVACGLGGVVIGFVIATIVQNLNRAHMAEQFKSLSNEALTKNLDVLLKVAKNELSHERETTRADWEKRTHAVAEMLKPLEMRLTQLHTQTGEMEKARIGAYEGLKQHLTQMAETQTQLRFETTQLKQALRKPEGRGRWGEMQLKRVLEMSGMIVHCDFTEQTHTTTQEDKRLRPDVIVHLPGDRQIVIDCKTPLEALLDNVSGEPEQIALTHQRHARHLREHVKSLSQKAYWQQFKSTPDFVVMFVPGEHFLSIALQNDPELFDYAFQNRVIMATPINLIGLLKTVAHAWRQEKLAEQAQKIAGLGKDLYDAMAVFASHFEKVGKGLKSSVENYNKAVGSFETNLSLRSRRLADEYGVESDKKIEVLEAVDITPRQLSGSEDDLLTPVLSPSKKQEVA